MKSIFKRKKNRDEGVPDLTINRISKKADIVLNICFFRLDSGLCAPAPARGDRVVQQ